MTPDVRAVVETLASEAEVVLLRSSGGVRIARSAIEWALSLVEALIIRGTLHVSAPSVEVHVHREPPHDPEDA